jgi:hypothetical protein
MNVKTALVTIAKDVDVEAGKLLHELATAEKATPKAAAAIAVILAAVGKSIADVQSAAQNPAQVLDISFDKATAADLEAVWSDVVEAAAQLGIKL